MCVHRGAPLQQIRHEVWLREVEGAEAAGPPSAARVDVGAGIEERRDHRAIVTIDGDEERWLIEIVDKRIVETRLKTRMRGNERGHLGRVTFAQGCLKLDY